MAIIDNIRNSLQRVFFGRSYQDCKEDLAKEKRKNAILRKELSNLEEKLQQEKVKNSKLRARIQRIRKENKKQVEVNSQKVEFKVYYSVLGVNGSTARFEFDIDGIFDIRLTEQQITRELSSESFFDQLMSLYDMLSSIDSSIVNGVRVSGFKKVITEDKPTPNLAVNFNIADNPKTSQLGSQKVTNPLFGFFE